MCIPRCDVRRAFLRRGKGLCIHGGFNVGSADAL